MFFRMTDLRSWNLLKNLLKEECFLAAKVVYLTSSGDLSETD